MLFAPNLTLVTPSSLQQSLANWLQNTHLSLGNSAYKWALLTGLKAFVSGAFNFTVTAPAIGWRMHIFPSQFVIAVWRMFGYASGA